MSCCILSNVSEKIAICKSSNYTKSNVNTNYLQNYVYTFHAPVRIEIEVHVAIGIVLYVV